MTEVDRTQKNKIYLSQIYEKIVESLILGHSEKYWVLPENIIKLKLNQK